MKKAILKRIIATIFSAVILCFACVSSSYAASNKVFFGAGINFNDGNERDFWLNYLGSKISTIVENKGYGGYQKVNQISANNALGILKDDAGIFAVHTHGTQTSISFSNNTSITMAQINALASNALSDVDLVVYGTCEAAKGGKYASNMVNSTFNKGAKVVIGFEDITYVDQMNHWLINFFSSYSRGKYVIEAASDGLFWTEAYYHGNAGGMDTVLIRY